MGIPSFYRQLCRRFPTLITKGAVRGTDWLCLDFNCAMYYVLHKMPPLGTNCKLKWENDLCEEIAKYMGEIVDVAAPTKGVYVSCDGVVCAAKRRQQRLRRFKGPWVSAMEAMVQNKKVDPNKWDQNALTPGSAFMARLGITLTDAGRTMQARLGIPVTVSTTAEPGEGEHKLLAHMRLVRPVTCTIYGLDADLILLSMLLGAETGSEVRLLREAQEFESAKGQRDTCEWRTLTVAGLTNAMIPAATPEKIRDFVACMSLLGNDFLPRSLTHTVRDDGIPNLIVTLTKEVWGQGKYVVGPSGYLDRNGLLAVIDAWAATQERDLIVAAKAGQKAARYTHRSGATPEETALNEWNAQPAQWGAVCAILSKKDPNNLREGWRFNYNSWYPGAASDYVKGLAWVWDYYSGRQVDQTWMFEEHLTPLWSDVAEILRANVGNVVHPPYVLHSTLLPDWIHLLAVLPAESVERLLPPKAMRLMGNAPFYWPTSWSVYDVGKTQMWECEPFIPMIPEKVLREWARRHDQ
jgi:5'-3' exonuclease